jgi:O-antigen ligase
MGAFLIIYAGIFAYYMRKKPDWYFIVGVFLMMMLGLEFLTYSRSALGGFILGALIIFLFSFRSVYKKHKKELLFVGIIALCGFAFLGLQYYDKAEAILAREGSSK